MDDIAAICAELLGRCIEPTGPIESVKYIDPRTFAVTDATGDTYIFTAGRQERRGDLERGSAGHPDR